MEPLPPASAEPTSSNSRAAGTTYLIYLRRRKMLQPNSTCKRGIRICEETALQTQSSVRKRRKKCSRHHSRDSSVGQHRRASFLPSISKQLLVLAGRRRTRLLPSTSKWLFCTQREERRESPTSTKYLFLQVLFLKVFFAQPTHPFYHIYINYPQFWPIKGKVVTLVL